MIEQGLEARLGIYDPALPNRATCLCIVGTRPEVIKMAPVVQKLQEADWIHPVLVTTGQHVELLEISLEDFSLTPDTQLVVDRSSESFNSVLAQVIDALLAMAERDPGPPDNFPQVARPILVTAHRRENIGDGLRSAFEELRHIADRFEDVGIFFPVHPNPGTREAAHAILGGHPRAVLTEPLSYREMVACLKRSWLVITDSGGLQEEAPTLGRPVLVLRDVTERPEAVATGVVRLVGTSAERLVNETSVLHTDEGAYRAMARPVFPYGDTDEGAYRAMARPVFPYGDGRAAGRIVSAMRALVGSRGDLPALAASGQLGQRSREVGGKPARADPQQPRQSGKRHDGRGGEGDRRRSPPACTARGSR